MNLFNNQLGQLFFNIYGFYGKSYKWFFIYTIRPVWYWIFIIFFNLLRNVFF